MESGGFDSWSSIRGFARVLQGVLESKIKIAVVYDSDYRSEQESEFYKTILEREVELVHFHDRKEIENYLLCPNVLNRAIKRALVDREGRSGSDGTQELDVAGVLDEITVGERETLSGQYIARYGEYFRKSGKDPATLASEALEKFNERWRDLDSRMTIVSGKDVLRRFRGECQNRLGITLTDLRIVGAFRREEVPNDLDLLLKRLEEFRSLCD